jgi:GNAT superfamily N-acetyltransferase
MTADDIREASRVQVAAFTAHDASQGIEPRPITHVVWERIAVRHRHFLTHDPGGSWVATQDEQIVGCALALKRESLWGLSLLVVDPEVQSSGIGRELLDTSLRYAEDCERAVILSTSDPRAMRAYATSGFDLFPQVSGHGEPDPASLPALRSRVRDGSVADAELGDDIDREVRGAPRGPDHPLMASVMAMFVVDDVDGRGYAYFRSDGEIFTLAATNDETADVLLWTCLARAVDLNVPANVEHMNAHQQWAIRISYRARLKVAPSGPVLWRGATPPRSFLPSGAYL